MLINMLITNIKLKHKLRSCLNGYLFNQNKVQEKFENEFVCNKF